MTTHDREERRHSTAAYSKLNGGETSALSSDTHPAATAQKALHDSLNSSPRVQSQLRLSRSLQHSGRVVAQAKLAQTLLSRTAHVISSTDSRDSMDETREEPPELVSFSTATSSSHPIQAITDVAAFQGQTPSRIFRPRRRIRAIDQDLAAYISAGGPNKLAAVGALIATINGYIGAGRQLPQRLQAAQNLLAEATAEQGLLLDLGAANGGLSDDLIQRAGGAGNIPNLRLLAQAITPAHALLLPSIVTAGGGGANLPALTQLVNSIQPANAALLPNLIAATGGAANLGPLDNLINAITAAQANSLPAIVAAAGGGANLAALTQVVNTIQPANASLLSNLITAAGGGVNLPALDNLIGAITPANAALLVQLIPAAGGAAGLATLQGLITAAGVANANLLNLMIANIGGAAQIPLLTGIINRHPGQGDLAFDLTQVANGVAADFIRLANEVPQFLQGAVVPAPASVALAVAQYNGLAAIAGPPVRQIRNVAFDHFLQRHTARFFDFGQIKPDNTQWPTTWGALTPANVTARLNAVLIDLANNANWMAPNVPIPNYNVPGFAGEQVQIAAKGAGAGLIDVGMFFPLQNVGANIYDHNDVTMRAIRKVL